jgi:hypothetical protein
VTTPAIERVRVLNGHTTADNAYRVDDYPYGGQLRCMIRYWIDTAAKGAKKGQQRFTSQTTDARRGNTTWNRPKASTYSLLAVMYLDGKDHVQWTGISEGGIRPEQDARWRLNGIYQQLTDNQRHRYDFFVAASKQYAEPWDRFARTVTDIAEHLRTTGAEPELTNGTWTTPAGRPQYLGAENLPIYLALARQQLTS